MLYTLDHVNLAKKLKKRVLLAEARAGKADLTSLSRELSEAQRGYLDILQGLLAEKDLDHPFDQDSQGIADFFKEASIRWDRKKSEMGL
tara:strand:- start:1388 stop:1654 length:267 start_codon:yes stop_codon:yes gene_type:complete